MPILTQLSLPTEAATRALAEQVAPLLRAGDCLALSGEIGAGKTAFARALIQARLAALTRMEDVPSPSFTLVQTYDLDEVDVWHVDLYRLTTAEEAFDLGLDDAFEDAITLLEWPERLGDALPDTALRLHLTAMPDDSRVVTVHPGPKTRNDLVAAFVEPAAR